MQEDAIIRAIEKMFAPHPSTYIPESAYWFQTIGKEKGYVYRVNGKFGYRVHNTSNGKILTEGIEDSYASARVKILKFFYPEEYTNERSGKDDRDIPLPSTWARIKQAIKRFCSRRKNPFSSRHFNVVWSSSGVPKKDSSGKDQDR